MSAPNIFRTAGIALPSWIDIESQHEWEGILLGNGASLAVWSDFGYPSLFEKAKHSIEHPLTTDDRRIFQSLETTNFEAVLADLAQSEIILKSLDRDWMFIRDCYISIRRALVEAVKFVHVRWNDVSNDKFDLIKAELAKYRTIYSTNYDLIVYWSIMHGQSNVCFDDSFRGSGTPFDHRKIVNPLTQRRVFYLHGGLHLYRTPDGETVKRSAAGRNRTLLDLFGTAYLNGAEPLFISEGKPKDKLASIHQSTYLRYAYNQFSQHQGNLVIFGHSLGDSDSHLVEAIRQSKPPLIAVSMMPGTSVNIEAKKARLRELFEGCQVLFFNALTHPLGSKALKVHPAPVLEVKPLSYPRALFDADNLPWWNRD